MKELFLAFYLLVLCGALLCLSLALRRLYKIRKEIRLHLKFLDLQRRYFECYKTGNWNGMKVYDEQSKEVMREIQKDND